MTLYMRSKPYKPVTYVVVWVNECIVKAGFTGGDRWKIFRARGAKVAHLFTKDPYAPGIRGVELEMLLEQALKGYGTPAFADKASAAPYLALQGAGYTECYRIPSDMLSDVIEHVLPSIARAHAFSTSTDVTDGRTNEDSGSVQDQSYESNARKFGWDSVRWARRMNAYRYAVTA